MLLKVKLSNLSLGSSYPKETTLPSIEEFVIVKFLMSTNSAEPLKQKSPMSLVESFIPELEISKDSICTDL